MVENTHTCVHACNIHKMSIPGSKYQNETHTQQSIHFLEVVVLSHHKDTEKMKVSGHCSELIWRAGHHWQEVDGNGPLLCVVKTMGELQGNPGEVG